MALTEHGLSLGRLSFSPGFLLAAAVFLWKGVDPVLRSCLQAATLHELGHLGVCCLLMVPVTRLRLSLLGAELDTGGRCCSGGEEAMVAFGGPAVNLVSVPLSLEVGEELLAGASLLLGLFNLLPMAPLDGSRLLHGLLSWRGSLETADRVTLAVSRWGHWLLLLPGAVLAALGNPSLLLLAVWMTVGERTALVKS